MLVLGSPFDLFVVSNWTLIKLSYMILSYLAVTNDFILNYEIVQTESDNSLMVGI